MIKLTLMISIILQETSASIPCGINKMFPATYELTQKDFMSYSFKFGSQQSYQQITVFGWMKV